MMENIFSVSLRLTSNSFDFKELIPEIKEFKYKYNKKGDNLTKNGKFKAKSNILLINECFIGNKIDFESNGIIISKLTPLLRLLSTIKVNDLTREVFISGSIENQQFGFFISLELIRLLVKNNYSISFSGISYL